MIHYTFITLIKVVEYNEHLGQNTALLMTQLYKYNCIHTTVNWVNVVVVQGLVVHFCTKLFPNRQEECIKTISNFKTTNVRKICGVNSASLRPYISQCYSGRFKMMQFIVLMIKKSDQRCSCPKTMVVSFWFSCERGSSGITKHRAGRTSVNIISLFGRPHRDNE